MSPESAISLPLPMGVFADDDGNVSYPEPLVADPQDTDELKERLTRLKKQNVCGNIPAGVVSARGTSGAAKWGLAGGELKADDLEQAGWGVMFGVSVDPDIRTKLSPLIERRRQQVNDPDLFKDNLPPPAAGVNARKWLQDMGSDMNVVEPSDGVPYYILIVASPADIPFDFQYELDLYFAVGRLWLRSPQEYENYANSVVNYETMATVPTSRQMAVFAADYEGQDNGAGKLVCNNLAAPLAALLAREKTKFGYQLFVGETATKDSLRRILAGQTDGGSPAILFTGTHGLQKAATSPLLGKTMGALVCQDWKGEKDLLTPDKFYAAWDVKNSVNVHGMVHVMWACYGLGWPAEDTYSYQSQRPVISPDGPMMAQLPQALLGRENGALAVLGHIDRGWSCSYTVNGRPQPVGFKDVVEKLMNGYRLGSATDAFNMRWAALTLPLEETLKDMLTTSGLENQAANQWLERDDARNFILHGDPAVKLRVSGDGAMPPFVAAVPTGTA